MRQALERLEGLFVGQLNEDEMELFQIGIKRGWCYESYEGGAGFLGLARVRLMEGRQDG